MSRTHSSLHGRGNQLGKLAGIVLDAVGSVWFGVSTLVLVLAYCWIGSAGAAPLVDWFIRQSFEKTELEWFSWWPFIVLVGLMCLSLTIVTVRRIPLTVTNAGVWITHAGILVLVAGSLVYFGLKKEGDVIVFRRDAILQAAGGEPTRLTVMPGAEAIVRGSARDYRARVVEITPDYELLTGQEAGKKTFAVQLLFEPLGANGPGGTFIRQLLAGYPEFTEDVVPGEGRALKVRGVRLLDESLRAELVLAPSDRLFLQDRAALHARFVLSDDWHEASLAGLPRYNEYVGSPAALAPSPGELPRRFRSLAIAPRWKSGASPLGPGTALRVTGFLPFARLRERWEPGGQVFSPLARVRVRFGSVTGGGDVAAEMEHPLHVPIGNQYLDVSLRWIEEAAELQRLVSPPPPSLLVRLPGLVTPRRIELSAASGSPAAVEGTGYTIEALEKYPHWSVPSEGGGSSEASMILVRVASEDESFVRAVVTPQAELSQDVDDAGQLLGRVVDERIELAIEDYVPPGLTLVAGPVGLFAVVSDGAGFIAHRQAQPNQPVVFPRDGMEVTIEAVSPTSRRVEVPALIPRSERDNKAGAARSVIQVELTDAGERREIWLPYSHYSFPSRAGYFPRRVALRDGRVIELVYSRETMPLPAPVALETFELETYPGGSRERDFISLVRFLRDGNWSPVREVRSNQPTAYAGWWFFQSTWDPPDPSRGYAGMNYTGLGVGNRHGVSIMLLGGLLVVVGTLWAFYVKPLIIRARRRREEATRAPPPRSGPALAADPGGPHA